MEDGYLVFAGGVAVAGDGWFATLALDVFRGEGESAGAQSEDKKGGEMHGSVALSVRMMGGVLVEGKSVGGRWMSFLLGRMLGGDGQWG